MNIFDAYRMENGELYQFPLSAMAEKFNLSKEFHIPFSIAYYPDVSAAVDILLYDGSSSYQWEDDKTLAWEFLKFLASEEIQQVTRQVEQWILLINAYRPEDSDLITFTEGELQRFLYGKQTALEMVDSLERKLEQYINE